MRGLGLAALLLLGAGTAQAEEAPRLPDAPTALRCAMWSAIMASQQANADDEKSFSFVMTWFVGLYEGASGRKFDGSATERDIAEAQDHMPELNGICVPLMQDFGERLQTWGGRVEAAEAGKAKPGS